LRSTVDYVEPGETKKLIAFWPIVDVEGKRYNATAEIDYVTGTAFKKSVVEVYRPLVPVPKVVEKEFVLPWWMFAVLMVTIIVAYSMYRLNK
jgi:hypothetical protein